MKGLIRNTSIVALIGLCGCSAWRDTYTISPAVKESARRYSDVMDDFADQALLANVLRAKDRAPMNFNDLSAITGSMSLSGTLGFTLPFGDLTGDRTTSNTFRNTFSPSLTGTTSPVITLGTLNTQGFMLTMIQPISTTYILSKWNDYPHELLLFLFVKSIKFPDDEEPIRNDPDSPEFGDFAQLIAQMVDRTPGHEGHVNLKSLMVLDPIGNPIPMGQIVQATTPVPSTSPQTAPSQPPSVKIRNTVVEPRGPDEGGGMLKKGTWVVRLTAVSKDGMESQPSSPQTITIDKDGSSFLVHAPQWLSSQNKGYNIYASASGHDLQRLNEEVRTFKDEDFLVSAVPDRYFGPIPTDAKAAAYLENPALRGGTYRVKVTYLTSSGSESVASPDSTIKLPPDFALIVLPPDKTNASGVAGFNVYVADQKQNRIKIAVAEPWVQPQTGFVEGAPSPVPPGTSYQVTSDYNVIQTINGLSDGQLHVGNVPCPDYVRTGLHSDATDLCIANNDGAFIQFYKEYQAQIVLCLATDPKTKTFYGRRIEPKELEEESDENGQPLAFDFGDKVMLKSHIEQLSVLFAMKGPGGGGNNGGGQTTSSAAGGGAAGGGGGGGGGGGATGGSGGGMAQVTLALQPNRISAILHGETCKADQIVLPTSTEMKFRDSTKEFSHIEWRSTAEVIQYLGALARYQERTIKTPAITKAKDVPLGWARAGSASVSDYIFTWQTGGSGRIAVKYRGQDISVPRAYEQPSDINDHSLESLSLLNELIAIAKISGSLPVSQPVQVLP
jgi:uncharacterized membrane protein YgcG